MSHAGRLWVWQRRLEQAGGALALLGSPLYGLMAAMVLLVVGVLVGDVLLPAAWVDWAYGWLAALVIAVLVLTSLVAVAGAVRLGLRTVQGDERSWRTLGIVNGVLALATFGLTAPVFLLFLGWLALEGYTNALWSRAAWQVPFE